MDNPGVSHQQMETILRKRGSDFDTMIRHHNIHKEFHKKLMCEFRKHDLDVRSVKKTDYTEEAIMWADIIVPAGGDGTFLLAGSKINSKDKPIVGFNSDPQRSEGYLCLPKTYSYNLPMAVNKIIQVFLGESVSSQVSYFEIEVPGYTRTKVKCSGLCVCTGTGSTSWNLSINRLSPHKVKRLLHIAGFLDSCQHDVHNITAKFNNSLIFDPGMFYTLRDQICGGVWPYPPGFPSDNFTQRIVVASKCYAANLVIDGGYSCPFNDGSTAELTSSPENSLRTLVLI
ncbi:hypothetical protein AAG570_000287 [Ranatra chinensis]|uniref:NAD(+) kinase n=1 Tax=Ranatra chinensis TaxID=642074 RepID=A0ABD0YWL4_9HEMI